MNTIDSVLDKAVEEICSDGIVSLMDKIIDYKFKYGRDGYATEGIGDVVLAAWLQ